MSREQEKPEPEHLQHAAEHERPHKTPVMAYLAILFAAAFLLMLLTYFMQQRTSSETIEGLKQSVTAIKSIEDLQQENDALGEEVAALKKTNTELDAQLQLEQESSASLMDTNQKDWEIICAMDWLGEIQELYGREKYKACRSMMEEFEANGLKELLPLGAQHTYDGSDALPPAERYQKIYDALY